MYLRYTQPPSDLYDWYEDYLQDEEEIDVKAGGGQVLSIGQMVYQFMTKLDWFSTLFPRIPVPIQKQIEKKIEQYCREQGLTVNQLSTGRSAAGQGAGGGGGQGAAGQDADYQEYQEGGAGMDRGGNGGGGARGGGHAMAGSGSRPNAYPPPINYRNDHDDRDYYAASSGSSHARGRGGYEDYPPAPLLPQMPYGSGGERERERDRVRDKEKDYDRHRSKHKRKHKHRQNSRSRSRSRSKSRHRSERHERKRDGGGGCYERSSKSRHNEHYEERERRHR
ncbi:pre-mRNA-splicing factor 38B isoform X2 [Drosophila rhopaloa]|nr:pre-mRNA-splicing factor 38B isoform X2 [Drosophila rhopaloa]XP_016980065.1 pre-mRNA-splicing factor 38B isoform X2 [Drosophila rhopaloa]